MTRLLIQGVEVIRESDRLIVRNTWAWASCFFPFFHLFNAIGFCGAIGVTGFLFTSHDTPTDRFIRMGLIVSGLIFAAVSAWVILALGLSHRHPYILDRPADRLLDGTKEVCSLSEIRHIRVTECCPDPMYRVDWVSADGRESIALGDRIDEFRTQEDAVRFATAVADFLGVPVSTPLP